MKSLAELSLKRPVTATMFFVSMLLVGLIAAFRLPLEFFPEVDAPFLFVNLPYPGSTPEEVEQSITRPVEEALSTLPGIKRMNSQSGSQGAGIFIEFQWDRDIQVLASEARYRLDAIRNELPDDLQRIFVQKFATGDDPVLRIRLSSNANLADAWELLEREMKRPLERIPGVARVDVNGVSPPEVEIAVSSERINAHGLALNDLAARLTAANFSVSAGQIDDGDRRLRVQPMGEFRSLDEIRDLPLDARGLRLRDVADVWLKPARVDYGRRLDLRPAVGVDIYRERNSNLVDVGARVLAEIDRIAEQPEFAGIQLFVMQNQAEGVKSSLSDLAQAGLFGSLLSILVLFAFLRHWPSTLMVSLAIPICFVMTLGAMYFLGITINVLSMMGLLLGVGMLVDNAVVVVESIHQQRAKWPDDPFRCAVEGTRGVQLAISAGTLTSIIVFVPNLFGEKNFISIYLGQVAYTITISLLCSWLVAVSLIPMLASRIRPGHSADSERGAVAALRRGYARVLAWTLAHRWKSVGMIVLLIGISLVPASQVKIDMFPSGELRELQLNYQWNGSYRLDEISAAVEQIERHLDQNRERYQIEQVYSWFSERGWAATQLKLRERGGGLISTSRLMETIREELPKLAMGEVNFRQESRGGTGEGIQLSISGDSAATLRELAAAVVPVLESVPGLRDVRPDVGWEGREMAVTVDRERAQSYGFSAQQIASFIGIALRGTPLREFRSGESEIPVWLRFAGSDQASFEDLRDFKLRAPNGEMVPLMAMVRVEVLSTPSTIWRQSRQTAVQIKANLVDGVTLPEARKAMDEAIKAVQLPPGYRFGFGGSFNQDDEAGQRMLFNTLLAFLMIFIVMAALFESTIFPASILSAILFSILGVFWLFWLTGTTFSIMASIGILVLMGVVVNNGIVMIEHVNHLRREGMSRDLALVQGCRDRLRPVLMTMGTTILGMIPLCIAGTQIGGNGPPYYPMARAIVGGLMFSTIVTLLMLPTIYALIDDLRLWAARVKADAQRRARGESAPSVVA
jgi:hydrophobic/amphiphilic exporter-1 (mainly G- bacteria), HAE1 family